jgi:hypothetical protein
VPQYRINGLNKAGGVVAAMRMDAPDDAAAIDWAAIWFGGGLFEVWQPGRFVWPPASRAEDCHTGSHSRQARVALPPRLRRC